MRIGRLKDRLELQAPDHQPDDNAGEITGWRTLGTLWAEVLPVAGNKDIEATVARAQQGFRVRLRWRRGIDVFHRFKWRDRVLSIESIEDPTGDRRELLAICESGRAT